MVHTNPVRRDISLFPTVPSANGGIAEFPLMWYNHTFYAMQPPTEDSSVINDEGATIHLQGACVWCFRQQRTARNEGDIYRRLLASRRWMR